MRAAIAVGSALLLAGCGPSVAEQNQAVLDDRVEAACQNLEFMERNGGTYQSRDRFFDDLVETGDGAFDREQLERWVEIRCRSLLERAERVRVELDAQGA